MNFFYALMFGAGASALAYSTLARRVGYGNNQSILMFIGVIFVFSTLVFFTILQFILHV